MDCGRRAWTSYAWVLAKSKGPDLATSDEAQTKTRSPHNDPTDDSQIFMKYADVPMEERDPLAAEWANTIRVEEAPTAAAPKT